MSHLLPYLVARSNAAAMDRRGPPGRLLTVIVMAPIAVVMFGFSALLLWIAVGLMIGVH